MQNSNIIKEAESEPVLNSEYSCYKFFFKVPPMKQGPRSMHYSMYTVYDSPNNTTGQVNSMKNDVQDTTEQLDELRTQIKIGLDDIATGNTRPFAEAIEDIYTRKAKGINQK